MPSKIYTIFITWREGPIPMLKTIIHLEERFLIDTIKNLPMLEIEKLEVIEGIC